MPRENGSAPPAQGDAFEEPDAFSFEEELEEVIGTTSPEAPDDASLNVLREFGKPPEYRTMARVDGETYHRAAVVLAKGRFLGSTLRQEYVANLFLMSRSADGYGSEQMKEVATRAPKERAGVVRRFLGLGGRDEGGAAP